MAREVLVINPSKRRRKTKKRKPAAKTTKRRKGVTTMAKRRRRTTTAPKRRRVRRNPSKRKVTRRVRSAAGKLFSGVNLKTALGNMPATQLGMFAAKWASKRWGEPASETDPDSWNWANYVKGAIGAVGAALLVNQVKPSMGQKTLEGGLNLMMYKIIQNELVAKNDFARDQFGADDYVPDEYLLTGENDWFLGEDGNMYPSDESYRLPGVPIGSVLEEPGPLGFGDYGDSLEPVSHLGDDDPYAASWFKSV